MPQKRILVVGGSTRAAADSVRRAGWTPVCADLFADMDLRRSAEIVPVRSYPQSLPEDVAEVRADGWFYCGALENHPEVLKKMMRPDRKHGPLLGTQPDALKLIRDPEWLAEVLRAAGAPVLEFAGESRPPEADGSWVQKPLASAGGRAIRIWNESASRIPFAEGHYFQRRTGGIGMSAVFWANSGQVQWLGGCVDLDAGSEIDGLSAFSYRGSIGPITHLTWDNQTAFQSRQSGKSSSAAKPFEHTSRVGCAVDDPMIQGKLDLIATALMAECSGLWGPIGLDFRLYDGVVWLTEVNPRYTASIEVLELANGVSFLSPDAEVSDSACPCVVAKQILYAESRIIAPDLRSLMTNGDPWTIPLVADVPDPESTIEAGWPICTVLASGPNFDEALRSLRRRVDRIHAVIEPRVS